MPANSVLSAVSCQLCHHNAPQPHLVDFSGHCQAVVTPVLDLQDNPGTTLQPKPPLPHSVPAAAGECLLAHATRQQPHLELSQKLEQ